ncbi:MAG: SelL-related redox protein [Planctomycetota bacterium]|jgi:peroxiredoxin
MKAILEARAWMKFTLALAGIYNIAWGLVAACAPNAMLTGLGVDPLPIYPQFWQCIGMIVGVYGLGYLIAARSPYTHWPITLVGLLGKILGPIGFAVSAGTGTLPMAMTLTIVTNDLVWWIPFAMILFGAMRYHQSVGSAYEMSESDDPLRELTTQHGEYLDDLAVRQPQLVVFLRHTGCTFCREALADLSARRQDIESNGAGIVLVYLGTGSNDSSFFEGYGLQDIPRIADPGCRLYRQFGLDLGGFAELFGPKVWIRGVIAGLFKRHGIGALQGNGFQMPGVYLYHCGRILTGYQHRTAADRPDYASLVSRVPQTEPLAAAV